MLALLATIVPIGAPVTRDPDHLILLLGVAGLTLAIGLGQFLGWSWRPRASSRALWACFVLTVLVFGGSLVLLSTGVTALELHRSVDASTVLETRLGTLLVRLAMVASLVGIVAARVWPPRSTV